MAKCAFPKGGKPCGKEATHEYKRQGKHVWKPCCSMHTTAAKNLGFEVRQHALR